MAERYLVVQTISHYRLQELLNRAADAGYALKEMRVTHIAQNLTYYTAVVEKEETT